MKFVLGIDLGTSYFKLGLFNKDGNLCGLGRVAVENDTGDGSLCELPTERFWKLLNNGLTDACRQADAQTNDIEAVGYSSQANSFLLLDRDDRPLTPLVLWPDSRTRTIHPDIQELWQRRDFLQTSGIGVPVGHQFSLNKLSWFRDNHSEIWAGVNRIMSISDYLTFSLTGKTVGDTGTACLLGLYDLPKKQWWIEALKTIGIQASQLSRPLLPGTIVGQISREGAKRLGLETETVFTVGGLDHHIAATGAGLGQIADLSESTGTVLACLNLNKQYQPADNRCIGPGVNGEHYYQLAFNDDGAGVLEWYQKEYVPDLSIEQLIGAAEKVKPGCDGLIAHRSANRYDNLSGFENKTKHHTHGHFVRAMMESTAASLAELVEGLCAKEKPVRIVATGGGAKSDLWLRIKADILGVEFVTTNCPEPACKGAAMLASVASGWFKSSNHAADAWISIADHFPAPESR